MQSGTCPVLLSISLPGEVNAGEAVVLPMRRGGVAVGERAEKSVGQQAGYLDL